MQIEIEGLKPIAMGFKEAAKLVGVSASTLRRMAKDGRLRTVQLGRRRVVSVDALRELCSE